tara:strand:+ start:135 stop:398 length:264 start_codon:yes stop_codon:yes gene_type:complete
MEIPNNLSVQQLLQLRELIKKNVSQKQMRAATIKKYHTSDKGKEKLRQASKKYYHKNKKIKKEKELSKKISELEEQLKELKIKYSEI